MMVILAQECAQPFVDLRTCIVQDLWILQVAQLQTLACHQKDQLVLMALIAQLLALFIAHQITCTVVEVLMPMVA